MARMGKKRRNLESRNCLSVKSVKSVVQFLWLRLAAPSLRACVGSSSPVKPGQTWSNHFPCLDHARQINGSACPSTTYTPSHEAPYRNSQTQSNQSNLVKPTEYWSAGVLVFHHPATPPLHQSIQPILLPNAKARF